MQDSPVSEAPARRPRPMLVPDATCSVRVLRPFAKYLALVGHDAEAWLAPHGLSLDRLQESDLRLPHVQAMTLLARATALSGDSAIGVRAAGCEEPDDFDVVGYAAANCATLGEAMRLAARFIPLVHDGITMELDVAPPMAALRVRVMPGLSFLPPTIEFLFASLLVYGSRFIGRRTRPLRVELAHPAPADTEPLEEAFREVRFDAGEYVMWTQAAALDLPHSAPDRSLLGILTSHADGRLRQLSPSPRSFAEKVRAAIGDELATGSPGVEQVARRLAISPRTLHRRLSGAGTSYGELVDDVRRSQAMLHLAGSQFTIGEISSLLGFGHPNAFHKAFKRWTRMTPAQYREEAHMLSSGRR
jgi:AraC-like DNA-binding protein